MMHRKRASRLGGSIVAAVISAIGLTRCVAAIPRRGAGIAAVSLAASGSVSLAASGSVSLAASSSVSLTVATLAVAIARIALRRGHLRKQPYRTLIYDDVNWRGQHG